MKTYLAFVMIATLSRCAASEVSVAPPRPDIVVLTENDVDPDSVRMAAPPGQVSADNQVNVLFRLRSKTSDEIKGYVRKRVQVKIHGVVIVEPVYRCTGLQDAKNNYVGLCLCLDSREQAKTLVKLLRGRVITDI